MELRCLVCEKSLPNIMEGQGVQPSGGLAFLTSGHYGSMLFDPLEVSQTIEICVCDDCLAAASKRGAVIHRQQARPAKYKYKPFIVENWFEIKP